MEICLVRHGETDWNKARRLQGREDTVLNAEGRKQAHATAAHLAQGHWDLIVTSPLRRAAETTEIIAAALGHVPVIAMADLVERDYGAASGLTPEERRQRYPNEDVPGIEPPAEVRARAAGVLDAMASQYPHSRILVVAHGGIINAILAYISGKEIGTGKTVLGNACLSVIRLRDSAWEVESYNLTAHLG